MTQELFLDWLSANPLAVTYLAALLLASLACFLVFLLRSQNSDPLNGLHLSPWRIAPVDFGLFMVCLILWFIFSGELFTRGHRWWMGPDAPIGPGANLIGGFLLQFGMLYLFLRFRRHFRDPLEEPLSPRALGWWQAGRRGLFYFLATLPLVYGISTAWHGLLELLRRHGWEIDLPMQDAVLLFREADNPLQLAGLIVLAVVVAPVVEETVFRGGVYRFLRGHTWRPLAVVVSGVLFGLIHGNLQSLPGLIAVGIFLGLAYERTANLGVPVFFHACFNLNSVVWLLVLPDFGS